MILLLVFINASSLTAGIFYGSWDSSLYESTTSEDELRYVSKIKEAEEGRWLMGNPFLIEYRDQGFSPSGFLEWIPATFLRIFQGDLGIALLVTDLLWSAIAILLVWAWLRALISQSGILWGTIFLLFSTHFGGELFGILRDTAPKFTFPFFGTYLLLLTLRSRNSLRQIFVRGVLIGIMFYSYPYHWSLCLITEAIFLLYRLLPDLQYALQMQTWSAFLRSFLSQVAATLVPFVVLAAPLALSMRSMLKREEFYDFYDRYHIVYTHIPAAPKLQLIVLAAIGFIMVGGWIVARKKNVGIRDALEASMPLLLPLLGMMALLNANVITGKDPELLGHGGRVIFPIVTASYAMVLARILSQRFIMIFAPVFCIGVIGFSGMHALKHVEQVQSGYSAWEQSPEQQVLLWLRTELPADQIIAAPRVLSEKIPVFTEHSLYFAAGAHFFFVPIDELVDRYLGWVGLYPNEKEPTETASVIIFGNHPGAQWSKERTLHELLSDTPFTKTMADYIPRQDLRRQIDEEHLHPDDVLTRSRLENYGVSVVIVRRDALPHSSILKGFSQEAEIGPYTILVAASRRIELRFQE